jgi:hypothetical protein
MRVGVDAFAWWDKTRGLALAGNVRGMGFEKGDRRFARSGLE